MPVGIINVNVRCCIYEKQEAGLEFSMVISKTWDCGTVHMINFKGFLIRLEFVNNYGNVNISIPSPRCKYYAERKRMLAKLEKKARSGLVYINLREFR